jgi:hypothetical protein
VRTIDGVSLEFLGVTALHQSLRIAGDETPHDGVLGGELCRRFLVTVDFRARRITLRPRSTAIDVRRAVAVPADFAHGVPVISATVSAPGAKPSDVSLVIGLAVPPRTVSFNYRYAAESGLLDTAPNSESSIELRGITKSGIVTTARLPREPERSPLLFADGVVSAQALTPSWIASDTARGRILIGR